MGRHDVEMIDRYLIFDFEDHALVTFKFVTMQFHELFDMSNETKKTVRRITQK